MMQGLTAMKPRQVLLSSSSAKIPSNGKPLSLSSEQRPLLLQAICRFLESSGFSKTLKKFLSEASLEKDSWKDCLLSLEDACCMYLDARSQNDADANISSDKISEKTEGDDTNMKSKDKKKKKTEKDSSTQNVEVHSVEPEVASEDIIPEEKSSKKSKDKKKKKVSEPAPESLNGNVQTLCAEKGSEKSIDPEESLKSKRKKSKGSKIDDLEKNGLGANEGLISANLENAVEDKNKKSIIMKSEEGTEQDKKSSKKRKKSSSEDNKSNGLRETSEDSKRRKVVGSDDEGTDEQVAKTTKVAAALDGQLENGQVDSQTPSLTAGKHSKMISGDTGDDKSASKKGSEKKQNGSTEPRAQIAFQRVKAEEVEFVDERLQDNSYWAKEGAETGYGAKAQEVLGQVRGRDFRHEKTKKKRGSYRGGLIDLHSHSVKFNYSDDDE